MATPKSRLDMRDDEDVGLKSLTPQCSNCMWRDKENPGKCAAFPSGIPLVIRLNEYDHRIMFPDDNGLRFIPRDPTIPHPMDE